MFFFLVPIFMIWGCIELVYREVPNNYSFKNEIISKNKDAQVLLFGNSHSFYGLNPDYFKQKAVNVSNISQSLYFDELLLKKHINAFNKCRTIVLTIDYFTLSQAKNDAESSWRKYFYKEQMGLDVKDISITDPRAYSLTLVPRFNLTIETLKKYIKNGTLKDCKLNGWAPYEGVNTLYNNTGMGKIIAAKHEDNSVNFDENVSRLYEIIGICKQKKINVILVTMPVTSYYAANVNNKKLALINAQCNVLAKESNVQYINLFQDKRFKNTDFYDTDHLNTVGAKKCSGIVNQFLNTSN